MGSKSVLYTSTPLKRFRKMGLKIIRHRVAVSTCMLIMLLYLFGVFSLILELSFETQFKYPLSNNISKYVAQLRRREVPDLLPINVYNYKFLTSCKHKCKGQNPRVVYIVKSARENFRRRMVIRETWGFEKRFSDVEVRTVFVVGIGADGRVEHLIQEEIDAHKDVVQAGFIDGYYNNTIKTMMAFKWAMTNCKTAQYYFFSDDDMYVSTKNVLRFLRHPNDFPAYMERPISASVDPKLQEEFPEDYELFAGYVFPASHPMRYLFSKWYVSLADYPYDRYPPYVTAGAFILSRQALVHLFYGSAYTAHFRFDDIYLGLVAWKVGLRPTHNQEFYFHKKPYDVYDYRFVIATHGYGEPEELRRIWNEQRSAGNA